MNVPPRPPRKSTALSPPSPGVPPIRPPVAPRRNSFSNTTQRGKPSIPQHPRGKPPIPQHPLVSPRRGNPINRGMANNNRVNMNRGNRGINYNKRGNYNNPRGNILPSRAQSQRPSMPTMVALPACQPNIKNARKQTAMEAVRREKELKQRQTLAPVLDSDPPCVLSVYIPEHTENCKLDVYSSMTVDSLIDLIIEHVQTKIELKGTRDGIIKELYGLYVPTLNTWCRPYKKITEYGLYKITGDPPLTELKQFSKGRDNESNFEEVSNKSVNKLKQSLAKSKVPAHINNRKHLKIELAEYAMKYSVECDQATTVLEILEFVSEAKKSIKDEIKDFEIYAHIKVPPNSEAALQGMETERILLRNHHSLSNCKFNGIQLLEIVRASQTVTIRLKSGKEIQQKTHPDRTIDEILLKAKASAGMTGNHYNLVLLPSKGAELILENNRTLRSYRIGISDVLLLASKERNKGSKLKEDQMIFLKISCPEFNCERTLKFKISASIGEVIYRFSKKASEMKDIGLYGLYPSSAVYEKQLNVKDRLQDLRIPNMAQVVVKLHGGKPNEIYQEKQVFGIDICKMKLVQADSEQDLKVPDILEELKRGLFDARGLDAEDIFKKKGNKLKEKLIAEELQAEIFPENDDISQYDPHDIANVILEWFSRLPIPILSKIDDDDLSMCAIDEEESHYLPEKLMEPYRSVFLWMLELMFDITKNSKVNNMDIKTISSCFAPHMLHKPGDYMRKALQDQQMTSILIAILEGMGSDWGNNIHGGTMKAGYGHSSVGTMRHNKFLRHHIV